MTTITLITEPDALALLERAVEERGADFTYNVAFPEHHGICQYFDHDTDEPCCIVGLCLAYLGFGAGDLYDDEGETADVVLDDRFGFTVCATEVMREAQRVQDNGGNWGEALEVARNFPSLNQEDGV